MTRDPDELLADLADLDARRRRAAAEPSREALEQLLRDYGELTAQITATRDAIGAELARLRSGRSVVRAYGQVPAAAPSSSLRA